MRKLNTLVLSLLVVLMTAGVSFAQKEGKRAKNPSDFKTHFYVFGNVGGTSLFTDMNPTKSLLEDAKLGYGGGLGLQISPVFGGRFQFINGKYQATGDMNVENGPNKVAESSAWDVSAEMTIDFTNIFRRNKTAPWGIYGFWGAGYSNFSSMITDEATGEIEIDPLTGKEYRSGAKSHNKGKGMEDAKEVMVIPFGAGLYFDVTPKLSINVEQNFRWAETDSLDMVKKGSEEFINDLFGYTSIGATYHFRSTSGLKKMRKHCDEVTYKVTPEVMENINGKVAVKIEINYPENYFDKKVAVRFAPYVKYGDQVKELPAKFFKGEKVNGAGEMVNYKNGGTFTYTASFDYEPAMANSELWVYPLGFDAKKAVDASMTADDIRANFKNLEMCETKLADGINDLSLLAGGNQTTILADDNYQAEVIKSEKAVIYFIVDKTNYKPLFALNKAADAKAQREALNNFLAEDYRVKDIVINGYASPEYTAEHNIWLADNRATTGNKYIRAEINKMIKAGKITKVANADDMNYSIMGHGADWDGFLAALQISNVADKETMMNVIRSAGPDKKEKEIRNMMLIYPEVKEILGKLRRTEIVANAYENRRTAEQISAEAISNPAALSVEELLYAATLTEDAATKAKIYYAAAKAYPKNAGALNNAAVAAIDAKEYNKAATYLAAANKIEPNNKQILNNMGVVAVNQENWDKAEQYYTEAKKLGANVNYNLGVVALHKSEYAKALKLMGNKKCDANVAIAQVMLHKYDAAQANLKCAPATCKSHYLQAIVAARNSDQASVISNLTKAFEKNPKLKNKAANDSEFIEYLDVEEFINIIK